MEVRCSSGILELSAIHTVPDVPAGPCPTDCPITVVLRGTAGAQFVAPRTVKCLVVILLSGEL